MFVSFGGVLYCLIFVVVVLNIDRSPLTPGLSADEFPDDITSDISDIPHDLELNQEDFSDVLSRFPDDLQDFDLFEGGIFSFYCRQKHKKTEITGYVTCSAVEHLVPFDGKRFGNENMSTMNYKLLSP